MASFNLALAFLVLSAVSFGAAVSSLECEDFILGKTVEFAKTDAGEVRLLMGSHDVPSLKEHDVAVSLLTLEPRALMLPHYMDAAVVFYVQRGEAIVGWVRGKTMVKKELKSGDVYSVPAGAVVYALNTNDTEKLQLVGALDTSAAFRRGKVESFFVAGGINPVTALSGFRSTVLAAAFKVSEEEISSLLSSQDRGPIIRTTVQVFDGLRKSSWNYLESVVSNKKSKDDKHKKHKDDKHKHEHDEDEHEKHKEDVEKKHKDEDKKHKDDDKKHKDEDKDEDKKHKDDDKKHKDEDKKQKDEDKKHKDEIFNIFERRLFENDYGWIASTMGEEDVGALAEARFGVSVVKLRAGSLLAPHWNPQGAEFGIVTSGSGNIQIAFPNGTNAVDARLERGTVFYVPQFLPVCQSAAEEDFEFVKFTVSSLFPTLTNKGIQFIAGEGSVLQKLDMGILALAFNLPDHLVSSFLNSQEDEAILPLRESV